MLAEFSIIPLDKGPSFSEYVARVIRIVEQAGLPYKMSAMGTIVEGSIDEVFDLIKKCHAELAKDCTRISIRINIDDKIGKTGQLTAKIESVEKKLGKKVNKY